MPPGDRRRLRRVAEDPRAHNAASGGNHRHRQGHPPQARARRPHRRLPCGLGRRSLSRSPGDADRSTGPAEHRPRPRPGSTAQSAACPIFFDSPNRLTKLGNVYKGESAPPEIRILCSFEAVSADPAVDRRCTVGPRTFCAKLRAGSAARPFDHISVARTNGTVTPPTRTQLGAKTPTQAITNAPAPTAPATQYSPTTIQSEYFISAVTQACASTRSGGSALVAIYVPRFLDFDRRFQS